MAFVLPVGFDRADGKFQLPPQPIGSAGTSSTVGTPTPYGAIVIQSPNGGTDYETEELTESPEIERAEQATFTHRLTMSWRNAVQFIGMLARGTFVQDSGQYGTSTIWRILSSRIRSLRGDKAELSYVAESISFDSPPDEYQMIPTDLSIDIIKHPRYFYALYPLGNDFLETVGNAPNQTTRANVKMAIIRAIQTYRDSPYFPIQGTVTVNGVVQNNIITTLLSEVIPVTTSGQSETSIDVSGDPACLFAIAAAGEIIQKLWFQIDAPYVPGFQVKWSQYFFAPVYENPGGYLEDPVGVVPEYFMAPGFVVPGGTGSVQTVLPQGSLITEYSNLDTVPPLPKNADNIFSQMPLFNPQCFSLDGTPSGKANISWLRQADEVEYQRTWFKVTRTWIGSPIGHWDRQIYGGGTDANDSSPNRPTQVSDYLPLPTNTV